MNKDTIGLVDILASLYQTLAAFSLFAWAVVGYVAIPDEKVRELLIYVVVAVASGGGFTCFGAWLRKERRRHH